MSTPRTEREKIRVVDGDDSEAWVEAGFAEKLEREIAEAQACIRELKEIGDEMAYLHGGFGAWRWAVSDHKAAIEAAMEETK
jgi:hypothetical protein